MQVISVEERSYLFKIIIIKDTFVDKRVAHLKHLSSIITPHLKKSFQFHLIGHEFQVEMDMSSFPRMLQFKRKMLPHAQLLRWSNWFSQWKFTVKHIKGTENILADFLSRPKAYKLEENYPKDASRVQKHTPHFISIVFSVTSHKEEGSSSNPTPTIPVFDLPEEIVETIRDLTFEKRAKLCYKMFLTILLKNYGLCIRGLRFHPDYPFLNIFHIHDLWRFPKESLCFFYYLCESFTIGITFNAEKLLSYVFKRQFKDVPPHSKYLLTMLQWFVPHHQWTRWVTTTRKGTYVLVMFRRPGSFLPPRAVNDDKSVMYHAPYCVIHDWYKVNPSSRRCERKLRTLYADTRILMARANSVDPDKIPYYVMWNTSVWNKDHLDAYKWIEANGQWLYENFDHCDVETSDDDDDAR
ncbi:hypothetical protein Tco_0906533 [Tanacetum coccineum]|uniref:Reverse transcriptase RNase H-like domain-containing protein n=1 Tax=Tanacetum coccineum TaxID=301880 RepID=A0ABQ5CHQ3_9ASTR